MMSLRHFGIDVRGPLPLAWVSLCRFHATSLVHPGRFFFRGRQQRKATGLSMVAFNRLPAAQDSQLGRTLDKIKAYSREFVTLQVPQW